MKFFIFILLCIICLVSSNEVEIQDIDEQKPKKKKIIKKIIKKKVVKKKKKKPTKEFDDNIYMAHYLTVYKKERYAG